MGMRISNNNITVKQQRCDVIKDRRDRKKVDSTAIANCFNCIVLYPRTGCYVPQSGSSA